MWFLIVVQESVWWIKISKCLNLKFFSRKTWKKKCSHGKISKWDSKICFEINCSVFNFNKIEKKLQVRWTVKLQGFTTVGRDIEALYWYSPLDIQYRILSALFWWLKKKINYIRKILNEIRFLQVIVLQLKLRTWKTPIYIYSYIIR